MREEFSGMVGTAVAKTTPAVAVATLTADRLVVWATLAYIILQAAYLLWRWRRDAKKGGPRGE